MTDYIDLTMGQYKLLEPELRDCGLIFLISDIDDGTKDFSSMKDLRKAIRDYIKTGKLVKD